MPSKKTTKRLKNIETTATAYYSPKKPDSQAINTKYELHDLCQLHGPQAKRKLMKMLADFAIKGVS